MPLGRRDQVASLAELYRTPPVVSPERTDTELLVGIAAAQQALQQGLDALQRSLQTQIDELRRATPAAPPATASADQTFTETLFGLALRPDEPLILSAEAAAHPSADAWRASIAVNLRLLRALEWWAGRRSVLDDLQAVLSVSRAAGEWACTHHPGLFTSPRIEALLRDAGRRIVPVAPERTQGGPRRRVLHVLSSAHGIGGHTKLVERWMRFDEASEHAVALTEQGDIPVPEAFAAAADGRITALAGPTPVQRVHELASLFAGADLVVLHIHPHDAVAVAAAGSPDRPPVVFLDHGDHQFWLGTSADLVVNLRPSGQTIALQRRGVAPDRNKLLPLPLDPAARTLSRAAAKTALGLPPDAVVLVTMASAYKFAPVTGDGFTDMAGALLARCTEAHILAVGPVPDSPGWAELAAAAPGRVHVTGPVERPADHLEAADVYLDSYPYNSVTSLLEAAQLGTPVVSRQRRGAGPTAFDDPGFVLAAVETAAEWEAELVRLIGDPVAREAEGAALAVSVGAAHDAAGWRLALAEVYAAADTEHRSGIPQGASPRVDLLDGYLVSVQESAALGRPAEELLASYGLLPPF